MSAPTSYAIILANGYPPPKGLLMSHLGGAGHFVCADGGANTAARFGITPDLIIGDLDSIFQQTIKKFSGVTARRIADQNSTDLEKALVWLIRKGFKEIRIFGATGGRLDHTIGNLSALAKFSRKTTISMYDLDGEIMNVTSDFEFEAPPGTVVSLLPLTLCEGIITRGLKWELRYESLALGQRESTSNVVVKSPVSIKVRRGTLLLFRLSEAAANRSRLKE